MNFWDINGVKKKKIQRFERFIYLKKKNQKFKLGLNLQTKYLSPREEI